MVEEGSEETLPWRRAYWSWVLKDEWPGHVWRGRAQEDMMALREDRFREVGNYASGLQF